MYNITIDISLILISTRLLGLISALLHVFALYSLFWEMLSKIEGKLGENTTVHVEQAVREGNTFFSGTVCSRQAEPNGYIMDYFPLWRGLIRPGTTVELIKFHEAESAENSLFSREVL